VHTRRRPSVCRHEERRRRRDRLSLDAVTTTCPFLDRVVVVVVVFVFVEDRTAAADNDNEDDENANSDETTAQTTILVATTRIETVQ
jgi:hypothetical protein